MKTIITDKTLLSGVLFLAIGTSFWIAAQDYAFGTLRRMGPGFFPSYLGAILAIIGLLMVVQTLIRKRHEAIPPLFLRPLLFLTAGILAFAALIDRAGLIAACLAAVLLSSQASRDTRLLESLVVAILMATFSVIVFIVLLGLPFRMWVI
nr:tripartite tricarboxylate transporter TctB family protein [Halomonas socia]